MESFADCHLDTSIIALSFAIARVVGNVVRRLPSIAHIKRRLTLWQWFKNMEWDIIYTTFIRITSITS